MNKSLENGYVPTTFKIAKVTPIFKAKDSQEFTNYRPISLLPTISKILEKVVHKRQFFKHIKCNILKSVWIQTETFNHSSNCRIHLPYI